MGTINHLTENHHHLSHQLSEKTAFIKMRGSPDFSAQFPLVLTSVENISAVKTKAADGVGGATAYKIFRIVFRGVGSVLAAPFKWGAFVYHQLRSKSEAMPGNAEQRESPPVVKPMQAPRKVTSVMLVSPEVYSEVRGETSKFPDVLPREIPKLPRLRALNLPTPSENAPGLRRTASFEQIVKATRKLGSWNSQAGDIAIDWIVGKPALTDGRRVRIVDRHGSAISLVASAEDAPGGEDIYLMLEGGHYSPVKLTADGRIGEIVPTPGDGNCFYRAVLSEISDGRVLPSQVSLTAIQEMRHHVANQIVNDRQNIEAFL